MNAQSYETHESNYSKYLSNLISLYPLFITILLFCIALLKNNLYLFFILAGILSTEIPVFILKSTIKDPRPIGAKNCNLFNLGTKSSENGFPSGHTTFSTFIFIYLLYQCIQIQKENGNFLWTPVLIAGLFGVAMPFARVQKKCHTVSQVWGGLVLGSLWAGLYILLEENVFIFNENYQKDKRQFMTSFLKQFY